MVLAHAHIQLDPPWLHYGHHLQLLLWNPKNGLSREIFAWCAIFSTCQDLSSKINDVQSEAKNSWWWSKNDWWLTWPPFWKPLLNFALLWPLLESSSITLTRWAIRQLDGKWRSHMELSSRNFQILGTTLRRKGRKIMRIFNLQKEFQTQWFDIQSHAWYKKVFSQVYVNFSKDLEENVHVIQVGNF